VACFDARREGSMAAPVKVVVAGALGRVGREMMYSLAADREVDLVGGADPIAAEEYFDLPAGGGLVPLTRNVETLLQRVRPRVLVDFTVAEAALANARVALRSGVSPVIGTTGLGAAGIEEIGRLAREAGVGAVIAPNFAIGANLMMYFARLTARFMSAAEIIELHHDGKVDAPSGTAYSTAQGMREARGEAFDGQQTKKFLLEGVRGGEVEGIRIHSVRLPGLVAHQEVIFGGRGQTLTIRHDSYGRDSFVPGVLLAVKEVVNRTELVYGLDKIMGLGE
jgi:4-hydroxy-tetrahydrodipicolinate reductase